MSAKKSPAPPVQRNWLWPVLIAVVVVLGVIAVVAAKNKGSSDQKAVDAQQVADVTVTGDALAPFNADQSPDPAVGATVPKLEGSNFTGDAVTIGPDGGPQVIMFVAHWCPHCQAELPRILAHIKDQPLPDGVTLNLVSTAVKPAADNYPPSAWITREGWEGTVLADSSTGQAATAYGLSAFPYFVAVTADGTVAQRISGEISNQQFDDLVAAAQGQATGS